MSTIANRLKEIRVSQRLNQKEFSKRIGVTNSHVSGLENSISAPSESLIKLICKEFGVNEEWLKTGEEPMYLEDLSFYTDRILSESTSLFNKLLSSKNENVRHHAARLSELFSEITNVNDLDDDNKIIFLDLLINLFSTLKKYNAPIKDRLSTNQLVFDEILNIFFEQYKNDIKRNIDDFEKKLEEIRFK